MRRTPFPTVRAALAAVALLGAATPAAAQETVDVGVIKQSDIAVVQKLLYPKEDRSEMGFHLGWMPFDAYTTTPVASITVGKHFSETLGGELALGGGWSFKNAVYKELESAAYGVSPDAYRHLASVVADAQWSPVYAKLNWRGSKVVHHDVYGLGGLGLVVEQAMQPDHTMAFSPAISLGIGARLFNTKSAALRLQLRDDLLIQYRAKTADTQGRWFKQNVAITLGYVKLGKRK